LSIFPSIQDLENKTVDVGGWGNVDEAYDIIKNVQIVLIKSKINQKDYLVLNSISSDILKKSKHSVKSVAFLFKSFLYYIDY
jgi:hypothetical protein